MAWGCSMEASYRLIQLLMLSQTKTRFELWVMKIHYNFIKKDPEEASQNNHYLLNLAALSLYSHANLNADFREWYELLCSEMNRQFNNDGGNFEASTNYHQLSAEIFFICENVFGSEFRKEINFDVNSFIEFTNYSRLHNESNVSIGDTDYSFDSFSKFLPLISAEDCPKRKVDFSDSGLTVFRHNALKVFFWNLFSDSGGKGTHNHDDILSMTVFLGNKPIIGELQTTSYTLCKKMTRKFHSTLGPFQTTRKQISKFRSDKLYKISKFKSLELETSCQIKFSNGLILERAIKLKNDRVQITDYMKGADLSIRLIFFEYILVESSSESTKLISKNITFEFPSTVTINKDTLEDENGNYWVIDISAPKRCRALSWSIFEEVVYSD